MPASVAADAWSAPSVGFLAGVATGGAMAGTGMAERVCRWVSRELVAAHGRAALMVDDDNLTAIAVYERLGYRRRPVPGFVRHRLRSVCCAGFVRHWRRFTVRHRLRFAPVPASSRHDLRLTAR